MPKSRKRMVSDLFGQVKTDPDGCWIWQGGINNMGYGSWGIHLAHRLVYELLVGPIPEGLNLDHLCKNPPCVRPDHLEPVTQRENLMRGDGPSAVNAAKEACIKGHPFDAPNTYIVKKTGHRQCKKCRSIAERDRLRRLKGLPPIG